MPLLKMKRELRTRIRQESAKVSFKEKNAQAEKAFSAIETLTSFKKARNIAAYWSVSDELPTHDILLKWAIHKNIFLPVIRDDEMVFVAYRPGCPMREGQLRVLEPVSQEIIGPEDIDMLIIPGMAFDETGNRLGRGKGYYDNFLHNSPALKVGVCLAHQLIDKVPVDVHDEKVDMIVTCGNIIHPGCQCQSSGRNAAVEQIADMLVIRSKTMSIEN